MKYKAALAFLASLLIVLLMSPIRPVAGEPEHPAKGHARVVIPPHAVEVAPGVFSLGTAMDKGRVVEGYAIITYKKRQGKPSGVCNNDGKCQGWEDHNACSDCTGGSGGEPDTSGCYGFMARGAKWKTIEPYIVNPDNSRGLTDSFVSQNIAFDISKWETAAGTGILGSGSSTYAILTADFSSPDDKNEVYFADIDEAGAIAITVVWGIWKGPPSMRELVEWDQIYDDVSFDWSMDCLSDDCTDKMDFENIATHELGHSVGLDDLYDTRCSEQTMYGYASYGETIKQDLADGDEAGVYSLYNE